LRRAACDVLARGERGLGIPQAIGRDGAPLVECIRTSQLGDQPPEVGLEQRVHQGHRKLLISGLAARGRMYALVEDPAQHCDPKAYAVSASP